MHWYRSKDILVSQNGAVERKGLPGKLLIHTNCGWIFSTFIFVLKQVCILVPQFPLRRVASTGYWRSLTHHSWLALVSGREASLVVVCRHPSRHRDFRWQWKLPGWVYVGRIKCLDTKWWTCLLLYVCFAFSKLLFWQRVTLQELFCHRKALWMHKQHPLVPQCIIPFPPFPSLSSAPVAWTILLCQVNSIQS